MDIFRLKSKYLIELSKDRDIISIDELETAVEWIDGFTGTKHTHYVDLTIHKKDGSTEHVDFSENALPLTKYLYAQNQLENWELITINQSPIKW